MKPAAVPRPKRIISGSSLAVGSGYYYTYFAKLSPSFEHVSPPRMKALRVEANEAQELVIRA